MPDINITVAHKVAVSDTQSIVCDNSDYMVHWTLDEEWSVYDAKTMRTIYMDGTYEDKVFSGAEVELPVVTVPGAVQIGLFAGNIRTSRVAILRALPSVRSAAGAPADPAPDVYDQLMERMAQLENPDWAQNDPTAKDYVRNRTHYVSRESVVVVPKQEVTTAMQNNFNIATLSDVDSDALGTLYDSEDDTTIDVVFDGTSYPCKWLEQDGGRRIPVFGNLAIFNPSITDTGEPFCVELVPESTLVIACKVAGTHTVAVSYQQDVVHTLDPKYIPTNLAQSDWSQNDPSAKDYVKNRTHWVEYGKETPIFSGETVSIETVGDYAYLPTTSAELDSYLLYSIIFDEETFTRQAVSLDGYLCIGNLSLWQGSPEADNTGEPFLFRFYYSTCGSSGWRGVLYADVVGEHTISVTGVVAKIHTLPNEFLPKWVASKNDIPEVAEQVQADWLETDDKSKAYIKNKPTIRNPYYSLTLEYEGKDGVLNIPSDYDSKLFVVYSLLSDKKIAITKVRYPNGGKEGEIISAKTGAAITQDELPYGVMLLSPSSNKFVCINPI